MPHIPLAATPSFRGRSKGGFYGDTIEELDAGVGQILEALKRWKLEEKTLVIYTSDNGPWNLKNGHGGSALPLRGYKFQTYEGGMRVPCIMRWPGVIPEGATCSEIIASIDLLPTLAGLAKVDLPNDRVIDGVTGRVTNRVIDHIYFIHSQTRPQSQCIGSKYSEVHCKQRPYSVYTVKQGSIFFVNT